LTVVTGADVPVLGGYVLRGFIQEFNPKFTIQPYVDVGLAVSDTTTLNVGSWNSFHTGSIEESLGAFYESDVFASVTFVMGKLKPGVRYTLRTSPAGGYDGVGTDGSIGVSELAFVLDVDDRAMSTPLSPKFVIVFETTDTQADFGTKKGIYFEAGIRPTFKSAGLTFALPVKLGASLKDYYETFDGNGDVVDNKFGYLQFGGNASVPLSMMKRGSWEAHAGIDFIVLAEKLRFHQAGDDEPKTVKPVLNFGFSARF
jgi:hypothetical protein